MREEPREQDECGCFFIAHHFSNDKKITCLILICTNCCVTFIFWSVFAPFLSHDARITPSKTNKNISKI